MFMQCWSAGNAVVGYRVTKDLFVVSPPDDVPYNSAVVVYSRIFTDTIKK